MTDPENNPQTPPNPMHDLRQDPPLLKRIIAYRLLMALTPKPLSFMLPRIEGMEMFDIPSVFETQNIEAISSPSNLGFSDFGGPLLSSRSIGPVSKWFTAFDYTYWEAYPEYGYWDDALRQWVHETDRVYLSVIGTWFLGYRPTHVRVTHLGTSYSDFGMENVSGYRLCFDIDMPSGTEVPITFPSPDPSDDIFWLYLLSDHPTITNIEFLSPAGPCD